MLNQQTPSVSICIPTDRTQTLQWSKSPNSFSNASALFTSDCGGVFEQSLATDWGEIPGLR
ncbi:hypothetical protein RBSWK_04106 [Rhodopirellula baltica SWK14]|uniref:Uncharacterized protein n=1 Tax=Rhodopirellula baltica SWK14 TaxID=993516 RepID=L7CFV6_RHOBT|nr:hypothetical protein RBSWK_04106 [Rhodopirellula baltica SWK14]